MSIWKNLAGTLETVFRIGKGKATLDAGALTAARTFTLPDLSGTLALGAYPTDMRERLKNFERVLYGSAARTINIRQIGTSIAYGTGKGWGDVGSIFARSLQDAYGASERRFEPFASQSSQPVDGWLVQFYGGTYTTRLRGVTGAATPTRVYMSKGCLSLTVVYSKETDGGTIAVDRSLDNGKTWTAVASINCNGASALGQVATYTVGVNDRAIFRFTAPATGAGYLEYWCADFGLDTGIAYMNSAYGGSSLRMHAGSDTRAPLWEMYTPSKTPAGNDGLNVTFAPTAATIKPDLVIYSGPTNDSGAPTEWATNLPNAIGIAVANGSSVIIIIEPINTTADDGGTYRSWWDQARGVIYAAQAAHPDNVFVFDWDRLLGPDGHHVMTWSGDGVHPVSSSAGDPYVAGAAALCQFFGVPLVDDDSKGFDAYTGTEYTGASEPPNAALGSVWNDTSNTEAVPKVLIAKPRPFDNSRKGLWQCLNGKNARVLRIDDLGTEYGTLSAAVNFKGEAAWAHTETLGWGLSQSNFVGGETYTLSLVAELSAAVSLPITLSFGNFPNYLSLDPHTGEWMTIIGAGPRTNAGGSADALRPGQVIRHAQTFKFPTSAELAAATAAGVTVGNLNLRLDTVSSGTCKLWKDIKIERGASMTVGVNGSPFDLGAHAYTGAQSVVPVPLTSAANIATNAKLSNNFSLTLGQSATLDAPTNMVAGTVYTWDITIGGAGNWTLGYASVFKWQDGDVPVMPTAPGANAMISGYYNGTILKMSAGKNYA